MSDWTNLVSALLHIVGYTLFWFGVTSSEWRSEIGYSYGLWARCDDTGCISLIYENTAGYLLLVQCGIAGSFVLLTVSVVGVAAGELIRLCKVKQRHATRANYVICISAASGEILATGSIFVYGYNTVLAKDRYPVLLWGFAVTGLGVGLSLLGNILTVMGPVSTWDSGLSCLLPRRQHTHQMFVYSDGSATYSADSTDTQHGSGRLIAPQRRRAKNTVTTYDKKGCCYTSTQSSDSGASEINYRHYEEISFEDMPPPPLELLHPPLNEFAQNVHSHQARPHSYYREHQNSLPVIHKDNQTILSQQHNEGRYRYVQSVNPQHPHFQSIPPPPPPPPPPPNEMSSSLYRATATTAGHGHRPTPKIRQHQTRDPGASTLPPPSSHASKSATPSHGHQALRQGASRGRPRPPSEAVNKSRTLPLRTYNEYAT